MPKIIFLFLPDFTTWGKTAFYFLRDFWGLPRPRLPSHIPRPRSCPPEIDSRQGLPCLHHMGIPQWAYYPMPTQIIVHLVWVLFAQNLLTNTLMGITIDTYKTRAHPTASQSTPGTPPQPANRPARRVYHIRQPLARDRPVRPGGNTMDYTTVLAKAAQTLEQRRRAQRHLQG